MSRGTQGLSWSQDFLLLFILVPAVVGQFTLPFLYMPLRSLLPKYFGSNDKDLKVTTEHVRILSYWSLEKAYSENMTNILSRLAKTEFYQPVSFTAANLKDLSYQWTYEIPFGSVNDSLSNNSVALTLNAADFQQELLKYTGEKFLFTVNNVALRLKIPIRNLSHSYDPGDWETVINAMVSESSLAFSNKLQLSSVDALARLVKVETQELLNLTLGAFEKLVFPLPPKKAILDGNTTSTIFNSSDISEALYPESTLSEALKHEEIKLSPQQFGILYNMSEEQIKTLDRSTLKQIYHMCMIPIQDLLKKTLPDASVNVFGSASRAPPCPVLIKIKGNSISSFQTNPVITSEQTTVLRILTEVANLSWHAVRWSVDASLSDWEFLDAVTLPQLAEISGYEEESLRNDSASELVKLVFSLRENGTLDNSTENYRAFVAKRLMETFNLTLNEVATLTGMADGSLVNVSSPFLFKSFFNATVVYFKLNSSEVIKALQMTEEDLHYLPRQKWNDTIPVVIDAVVKIEATKLQMSVANLFQLIGYNSNELTISQLKRIIGTRIQEVTEKKTRFESDPISWYLANNSISDADYLNTSVHTLLLSGGGFTDVELNLVYDLKPDQLFILEGLQFSDLPRVCQFNTSSAKDKTLYNITKELVGIREYPALCGTTRFYVNGRNRNMSHLQTAFIIIENSTVSFVNLVEMVTRLPWRKNVWAFGLKMEDWTALYVLNQETFRNVTGFSLDVFRSKTLLQVFQECLQLQADRDTGFRMRESQSKGPTLDIINDLFNTNKDELIRFGDMAKADFEKLSPFEVVPLVYKYLEVKFSVSLKTLEASLKLQPGNINKLAPTEWKEVIPFVRAEVIRSGRRQLHVSLSNFAKLQQETVESLQNLTLAQLESKWDDSVIRLLNGKMAMENESVLHIITSVGLSKEPLGEMTILDFTENKINLTKSELLLLYNFSSIGIEALGNYTFNEVSQYCQISENNIYNKRPHDIVVSLLGHNNDMTCPKVASLVAAAITTVDELAAKSNFNVQDDVSLLTMFEDQFELPWPKIAWAVNASLTDWPVLGATSLSNISTLVSKSTGDLKRLKSFREITSQLLALSPNSYTTLLNDYRAKLVSKASSLFHVNSSKLCDNCSIVNLLWKSLTQLNSQIDFDLHNLPHELKVSSYEFNLTLPSQWSLIVFPIVKGAYAKAAISLEMSPARLSILLDIQPPTIENMTVKDFHDVLKQSIQPLISAMTALMKSSLMDLITASGNNFSALRNDSIFDLIDSLINIPIQNLTFIFNWTAEQQAILKNYTLDDMIYYRVEKVGNETLFTLASFVFRENLPPRTPTPPTLPPCKRGLVREGDSTECKGKFVVDFENT